MSQSFRLLILLLLGALGGFAHSTTPEAPCSNLTLRAHKIASVEANIYASEGREFLALHIYEQEVLLRVRQLLDSCLKDAGFVPTNTVQSRKPSRELEPVRPGYPNSQWAEREVGVISAWNAKILSAIIALGEVWLDDIWDKLKRSRLKHRIITVPNCGDEADAVEESFLRNGAQFTDNALRSPLIFLYKQCLSETRQGKP